MTLQLAEKRVKRGAALLDQKLPGWFVEIDLEKLNLASDCQCVLGQLACDIVPRRTWLKHWRSTGRKPRYTQATEQLKLFGNQDFTHGFNADIKVTFEELDLAWRRHIERRLRNRWSRS